MKLGALALVAAAISFYAGSAFAEGCEPILEARVKALTLPVHTIRTMTVTGITIVRESFRIDGKSYALRKDGTWSVEKVELDEAKVRKAWAKDWAKKTCTSAGTEVIDGEVMDILLNQERLSSSELNSRFWISQVTGLEMRQETTIRSKGEGLIISVYEYGDDVHLPPEALQATGD